MTIGAASVVLKDCGDNVTVIGVPAREKKGLMYESDSNSLL